MKFSWFYSLKVGEIKAPPEGHGLLFMHGLLTDQPLASWSVCMYLTYSLCSPRLRDCHRLKDELHLFRFGNQARRLEVTRPLVMIVTYFYSITITVITVRCLVWCLSLVMLLSCIVWSIPNKISWRTCKYVGTNCKSDLTPTRASHDAI